jgi:hypothetical protein
MGFSYFLWPQGQGISSIKKLEFQARLDILLEIAFSGAAEQPYTIL